MPQGPKAASIILESRLEIAAPPRPLAYLITKTCIDEGWADDESTASELSETWVRRVHTHLLRNLNELRELGRFVSYAFNSSSNDHLQGAAFIEPTDSPDVKEAKEQLSRFNDYSILLRGLSPREFEKLCAGVLRELGATSPVVTPFSKDEGIDFFGKLDLSVETGILPQFANVVKQLKVWIIGQAKHYEDGDSAVPIANLRELAGSVSLARGAAFPVRGDDYLEPRLRIYDPVFVAFLTTSRISATAWRLIEKSGMIGMDGDMIASFLADKRIGLCEDQFDSEQFRSWLNR